MAPKISVSLLYYGNPDFRARQEEEFEADAMTLEAEYDPTTTMREIVERLVMSFVKNDRTIAKPFVYISSVQVESVIISKLTDFGRQSFETDAPFEFAGSLGWIKDDAVGWTKGGYLLDDSSPKWIDVDGSKVETLPKVYMLLKVEEN